MHFSARIDSLRRIDSNFYEYNGKVKWNDSFVLLLSLIVRIIHKYLQSCDFIRNEIIFIIDYHSIAMTNKKSACYFIKFIKKRNKKILFLYKNKLLTRNKTFNNKFFHFLVIAYSALLFLRSFWSLASLSNIKNFIRTIFHTIIILLRKILTK